MRAEARGPHADAELDDVLGFGLLVHDDSLVRADGQDAATGEDGDAIAGELLRGVLADALVVRVEDVVGGLHDGDGDLVGQTGVQFGHVVLEEIVQLGSELHAGGPTAHDEHGEHLALFLVGHAGEGRRLEKVRQSASDGERVVNLLEEDGVLANAGGAEGVAGGADGDDELVVGDGELGIGGGDAAIVAAAHGLGLGVDRDRRGFEESRVAGSAGKEATHGLDERARLDGADGHTGQERRVEEVVARGDDGHVVQRRVDVLHERHGAPPGAEDEKPFAATSVRGSVEVRCRKREGVHEGKRRAAAERGGRRAERDARVLSARHRSADPRGALLNVDAGIGMKSARRAPPA